MRHPRTGRRDGSEHARCSLKLVALGFGCGVKRTARLQADTGNKKYVAVHR
ncbi:hypothetical protein FTUN_3291 [Frigoriglobus tundricola]|uniref:Uncharacterized protein n=1 Tax=Frigoriglobus tundricola TaxID=2774151 RepID=A0A6M5YNT9_9BACT|nr:hypothetical protein FTUN_3291 [Frigoriglobus tundricola]